MSEIKILPIFNQSAPGVWDDMLRVRIAAMQHNYNIKLTAQEISDAMSEFQRSWKRLSFNFAFGAYDGDKMVGCLNGDVQNKTAFIRHLYVLPEYQGQHIGADLLTSAEGAVSASAHQTDLVSLAGAEYFYRGMGYFSPVGTNNYVKKLSAPKCRILPLFYCSPSFERGCNMLRGTETDMPTRKQINDAHMPVFVEYDVDSKIRAAGLIDNGRQIIKFKSEFWKDMIKRTLDRYTAQNTR